jgi:carboxyl-terminal processing protease
MNTQLAALAKGANLLTPALAAARAARAPVSVQTILNIRNQCPAAIGGNLDLTAATALLANPRAYQAALLSGGGG